MSIIHEALKKTGQPIMTNAPKEPQSSQTPFRPELLKKKSRGQWGPFVALSVLLLVGAPFLAPLLKNPAQAGVAEISVGSALPGASANMKQQFAIEEAPLPALPNLSRPRSTKPMRFAMSGLVYSNEGSYCLINGKVMRAGDRLGDATLVEVTPTEAVLDYLGEKIVLTANA